MAPTKLAAVKVKRGDWILMRNDCFMKVVLAGFPMDGMWDSGKGQDPRLEHLERKVEVPSTEMGNAE